jgi:hypothetical protein
MSEAQAQQAQQQAQDPLTIIQMKELELKERELNHKIDIDTKKLQVNAAGQAGNIIIQQERIESEKDKAAATTMAKLAVDAVRENTKTEVEKARLAIEAQRVMKEGQQPQQPQQPQKKESE